MDAFDPIGGHPVGALAACALSEAAYSALDQPISILEPSPLLTFKVLLLLLCRCPMHTTLSLAVFVHGMQFVCPSVPFIKWILCLPFSVNISTDLLENSVGPFNFSPQKINIF